MADCRFERVTEHVDRYTPDERTDRPALGAVHGRDRTLLIEGGASVRHLQAFVAELTSRDRPPICGIALTHWHWDHSFGSAALDVPLIAHRDTASELEVQAAYDWSDAALDERVRDGRELAFCAEMIRLEIPERSTLRIVVPGLTFEAEHVVDLGDVHCVVRHVGGDHAADSSVAYVPDDQVVFLGDCLSERFNAPQPCLTIAGVRTVTERLRPLAVVAAISGHDDDVLDATEYAARLDALRRAADIVEAGIPSPAERIDAELSELIDLVRIGEAAARSPADG